MEVSIIEHFCAFHLMVNQRRFDEAYMAAMHILKHEKGPQTAYEDMIISQVPRLLIEVAYSQEEHAKDERIPLDDLFAYCNANDWPKNPLGVSETILGHRSRIGDLLNDDKQVCYSEEDRPCCWWCGKYQDVKLMNCSKCHKAKYCSTHCQEHDWKLRHKNHCEKK
jgi:hypothetical protein